MVAAVVSSNDVRTVAPPRPRILDEALDCLARHRDLARIVEELRTPEVKHTMEAQLRQRFLAAWTLMVAEVDGSRSERRAVRGHLRQHLALQPRDGGCWARLVDVAFAAMR
jgi:hypothetical protein